MARYDVYRMTNSSLVVDLQSDQLYFTNTRIVAPLLPREAYEKPIHRANPELIVNDKVFILLTHFLSAVRTNELRLRIANLAHEQYVINSALDMVFYGF